VKGIVYRNVCLRNVQWPLYIDTSYTPTATKGDLIPHYSDVRMEKVHSLSPGRAVILQGYDAKRPLQLTLDDVVVDGNPALKIDFARLVASPGGQPGQVNPPGARGIDCSKRLLPFPEGREH